VRPTRSSAAFARASADVTLVARRHNLSVPPSADSAASRAFSWTVRSGKTLDTWNVRPRPSRAPERRLVRDVAPASSIVPAVGR
jgi:hypothetical protein